MTDEPSSEALLPQSAPPASPLAEEWAEAWSCSWHGATEGMSLGQLLDAFAAQAVAASRQPMSYPKGFEPKLRLCADHLGHGYNGNCNDCRLLNRCLLYPNDTASERAKPAVDYAAWALEMCSLLDAIEQNADDAERIRLLCHGRFNIAEKHGVEVKMHPHLTGGRA